MKIAIVNDSTQATEILSQLISVCPEHSVVWTAKDGKDAVAKTKLDPAEIVLMDLVMPQIDGIEATKQIMEIAPCPIILVTSSIEKNKDKIYQAINYGAVDVFQTPTALNKEILEHSSPLLDRIAQISTSAQNTKQFNSAILPSLVAIGASTGGPQALLHILSQLPKEFSAPIVITQHLDSVFAKNLCSWLNNETPLPIETVTKKTLPQPGVVYIAATNDHLCFSPRGYLDYSYTPEDMIYRPSIDVFFKSLAQHYPQNGVAILLTGMGQDGAEGLLALRNQGWHTIAQDEESSVVFSMPRAAIEQEAAIEILSLHQITQTLKNRFCPQKKLLAQ